MTTSFRVARACGLGLSLSLASGVLAQWTSDPTVNTPIHAGAGDQGVPLVRPTADGGAWISWADNSAGAGYKHRVQRLNALGEPQLPAGGIVINTRTSTQTNVYDLEVDASGAALVTYDNGGIHLQRVLPDGTLAFGSAGLLMPGSATVSAQVAPCGDGGSVVCWGSGATLNFRRVTAGGGLGTTWTFTETGRAQVPSDMLGVGAGGDFILLWVRAEGTNVVTSRKGLKIQKWDGADVQAWNGGVPVDVYTSSASPSRGIQVGYFPQLVSDGSGGAIAAWYDTGATRNAWVQHYLADGTARFPANGAAASAADVSTELRLSASVAYHAADDAYTVAYETATPTQSAFGLRAQRLDSTGGMLWGGAGAEIMPTTGNHASFVSTNTAPDGDAIVTWLNYTGANGPMLVSATRLAAESGAPAWSPAILGVSTNATSKGRLSVAKTHGSDMLVAVWADGAAGSADVLAQNINADGTLGAPTPGCDGIDFNGDGLFPDNQDLEDFFSVFGGGPCSTGACGDIDFNNDQLFPDNADLEAYLSVFGGGNC